MTRSLLNTFIIILLLASCSSNSATPKAPWQEIAARNASDEDLYRPVIYQARVPSTWTRIDSPPDQSIIDSRLPLCEFKITDQQTDKQGEITIVIHNFPYDTLDERVPPQAQTARWLRQFDRMDPRPVVQDPYAHGGYAGVYLECSGTQKEKSVGLMAWAMALDSEHFRNLERELRTPEDLVTIRQIRGDYTIKATGPTQLMDTHHQAIQDFARSFELIQPLPHRL